MDLHARLEALVERLMADHGHWRKRAQELEQRLREQDRHGRQLDERLAQALRRVHELELERNQLKDRLAQLPDPASVEEARRRLRLLLEDENLND